MKNNFVALTAVLLISGCASLDFGRVGKDVLLPSSEHSIIVLGVAPSDYTVSIFPGQMKDEIFNQSLWKSAAISGAPIDGFVVAQVTSGQTLALLKTYRVDKDGSGIPFTLFEICGKEKTMVFEVPKGKIIYIGDIQYKQLEKQVQTRYGQNFESAKRYIDSHYPNLRDRLELGKVDLIPTNVPCTTTLTIPIYLPARR